MTVDRADKDPRTGKEEEHGKRLRGSNQKNRRTTKSVGVYEAGLVTYVVDLSPNKNVETLFKVIHYDKTVTAEL